MKIWNFSAQNNLKEKISELDDWKTIPRQNEINEII